jgi:hypothetical protein
MGQFFGKTAMKYFFGLSAFEILDHCKYNNL